MTIIHQGGTRIHREHCQIEGAYQESFDWAEVGQGRDIRNIASPQAPAPVPAYAGAGIDCR
ncbi:hypothetical protein C9427_31840 [Mesorhizobium helmanticense]|uniref:Uncharacterized protein n=1 Tax=Mesorhizobium helmanticense TaxID=1776423 RepID=A0A2T4ILC9_9HYPH|nr:hypothetical protein C9427_31840 [Mesorhizobium helmanticense]